MYIHIYIYTYTYTYIHTYVYIYAIKSLILHTRFYSHHMQFSLILDPIFTPIRSNFYSYYMKFLLISDAFFYSTSAKLVRPSCLSFCCIVRFFFFVWYVVLLLYSLHMQHCWGPSCTIFYFFIFILGLFVIFVPLFFVLDSLAAMFVTIIQYL